MKNSKIFYGYWILISSFVICMIASGCSNGVFTLFITPIGSAFGWNRTEIMTAFTILIIVNGAASPFAGRLLEKCGARKVIAASALILSTGLIIVSRMNSLLQFYLGYTLIGIGFCGSGLVSLSYVVSHWFNRKRGAALGAMSMGLASQTFTLAPIVGAYLIPAFGWRNVYLILSALTVIIILPLIFFVIRTKPSEMGLYPDGINEDERSGANPNNSNAVNSSKSGIPANLALKSSAFWLIGLSLVFNHTHLGVWVSAFPHLGDIGFSVGKAVSVLSIQGLANLFSFYFFGWLCDKIKPQYASAIGLGVLVLAVFLLMSITPDSPAALLWIYAIVMGLGVGSWFPTMSMLTSHTFGLASYGAIFGMMSVFQNLGGAIGPMIAGSGYDITKTYHSAFIIILILIIAAIPLVLSVKRPKLQHENKLVSQAE